MATSAAQTPVAAPSNTDNPVALGASDGDDWLFVRLVPVVRAPPSSVEPVIRKMFERGVLKLGRQVKSPQEKAMAIMQNIVADIAAEEAATGAVAGEAAPPQTQPGPADSKKSADAQESTKTQQLQPATAINAATPSSLTSTEIATKDAPILCVLQPSKGGSRPDSAANNVWFRSKVVSRTHAELWLKDGQLYIKDIGSSSGTFLNKLRLSPAGKASRPYPIRDGDTIQLGVDYQSRAEEIYKAVELTILIQAPTTASSVARRHRTTLRFRTALRALLAATNPYSSSGTGPAAGTELLTGSQKSKAAAAGGTVDCCICLTSIGPFQALFVAPCSHCFHYKCIRHILRDAHMFPCPVCRQTANLDASVSMESLFDYDDLVDALDNTADIDSRTGDDVDEIDDTGDEDVNGELYDNRDRDNEDPGEVKRALTAKVTESNVAIKLEGSLQDAVVKSEDTDMGQSPGFDAMMVDDATPAV